MLTTSPFTATLLTGATEAITLSRLSIRQLYSFATLLQGERVPELIQLCTGRPPEWLDTLADASYAALAKTCIELNFPRAAEVAKGDPLLAMKLMPYIQNIQTLAILAGSVGLNLNSSSSAPAPTASAAETSNAASTLPPTASSDTSPPASASATSTGSTS
ncbi:MAG: hypothetical protein RL376_1023 [Verrucomicrobiota bacterium]|jgi:hypothetical protein